MFRWIEHEFFGWHPSCVFRGEQCLYLLRQLRSWETLHQVFFGLHLRYQATHWSLRQLLSRDVAWAALALRSLRNRHSFLFDRLVCHCLRQKRRLQTRLSHLGQYDPRWRDFCLQDRPSNPFLLLVKVFEVVPFPDKRIAQQHARAGWRTPLICHNRGSNLHWWGPVPG